MRTGTVSYKLEDLKNGVIIPIGFVGENDFTKVFFDAEEIYKKYPNASVSMKVQPPKGGIYPATVTRDGNTVIWQVKEADVANRGGGELQLTFIDGETKIKTYIAKTDVKRSLAGNGPAPDPVQDWIDDAKDVLEEVEAAEIHQPIIGLDGYWYTWNQETGEYEKTNTKAQGADGHSPVLTSSKSGKTTTIFSDGTQLAQIQDGEDGQGADVIDDTSGEGDTDKTWSADKLTDEFGDVLSAIHGIHQIPSGGSSGQVLKKASGTDYDVAWGTEQGGGSQITGSDAVSKTINEMQYRKYYKIDKSMMVSGSYGTSSMGVTPSSTHIRTPIAIYFPKYAHLYIETFGNAERVYIGRYTLNGSWIGEKQFVSSDTNKTYFSNTDQYIVVDYQGFASPDNCTTVVYVAYVSDYEILNPSDVINGTSNQTNSEYYFASSTKTLLSIWQFKVKAYDVFRFKAGTNIHRVYVEYIDPSTMKTDQGMNTGWVFDGGRVIVPSDYIATVFFKNTDNTSINPSNYDAEFVLEQPSVQRERIDLEYGSYLSDSNRTFSAVYNGYYNAKRNILFLDIEDTLGVLPSDNLKNTTVYVMFYDSDQNFVSAKNFTGEMINVPSGAKYIGIYSENLNIESVEVSLYGCTKKPHFVKRMARQGAFPTNPSENLIFPVTKTTFSKLRLILPSTYKSEGTPTPLIVWMRGSHYQTSWDDEFAETTNPSIANYIAYLRDEGFAVCQMKTWGSYYISKYGDNVENASPYSVPTCINTFIKGIEYLTSRYNIDSNNIHLLGHSQAGQFQTYCVTFPPVPIKSICMFSPVCDSLSMPGSYLYADTRKCIAEDLDLDGDLTYYTGTSFSTYSTEGIAFLTANADKMRRKNEAFTGLIGGTPADWFADGIADGSAFWSGGTAHPELTNIYTHYEYAKLANVPVKIWAASDDDSTPYRKMVEVVKQWQNTGGEAIMRTMPDNTGGHHAATHGNVMSESVTTSTGVVYSDLPVAWYEAVQFMKQHMGK